jgi:predicted dehydrogenase
VPAEQKSGKPAEESTTRNQKGRDARNETAWEINGTAGQLLPAAANGNIQVADLDVRAGRDEGGSMNEILATGGSGAISENIARLYQAIVPDFRNGTRSSPDFAVALEGHRLLAGIEAGAAAAPIGK